MNEFISLHSWPQAILHLDGDGFFATVEQAVHPELKGKPVITGVERGIVAAASYEAKAKGVKRGVPLSEVKKLCPDCVMLPSDYETYSLFSKRMFAIMRDFSPLIEEYSIDEAFVDLTGLRRYHHSSYKEIGSKIKTTVEKELGISVSVGVSLSKSLAKLSSKFQKPSGLTVVSGRNIAWLLAQTPLIKVWGFGANTVSFLEKMGLKTALDYIQFTEARAKKLLGKIGLELWHELRGEVAYPVNPNPKNTYQSIAKTKTFLPPSSDPSYLLAHLLRNLESACIKARRYQLACERLSIFIKRQDFSYESIEIILDRPTIAILELTPIVRKYFSRIFKGGVLYRASGVTLHHLRTQGETQFSLFEDPLQCMKLEKISQAIDDVNSRYGKHTLFVADGLQLKRRAKNDTQPVRKQDLLKGETVRQHINIPIMNVKV